MDDLDCDCDGCGDGCNGCDGCCSSLPNPCNLVPSCDSCPDLCECLPNNPCPTELPDCCSIPDCCSAPDCCSTPNCCCFDCCGASDVPSIPDATPTDTNPTTTTNHTTTYIICIDTPSCDPCCCWDFERKKDKSKNQAANISAFKSNNASSENANDNKPSAAPEEQTMERDQKPAEPKSNVLTIS